MLDFINQLIMEHLTTSKPLFWKMDSLYKLYSWFNAWTWLPSIGQIFIRGTVSSKLQHLKSLWKYLEQPKDKSILYNKVLWSVLNQAGVCLWHQVAQSDLGRDFGSWISCITYAYVSPKTRTALRSNIMLPHVTMIAVTELVCYQLKMKAVVEQDMYHHSII